MEYAKGLTLKEYMQSCDLSRQNIHDLFIQLMHGLKHIHSTGLVHRDVKPENIFVDP